MKRKIYQTLLKWKKERRGEVALLIEGARRIGKSHIVEEFGRDEYESYILVDFSKVSPQVMEFFDLYLDDLATLSQNLELYFRCKLFPRQSYTDENNPLPCDGTRPSAFYFQTVNGYTALSFHPP